MFEKGNDIKATVVAYNKEWSTVYARLDSSGPYPKPLTVKVPIDEIGKLFRCPIKNVMSVKNIMGKVTNLAEDTEVIFKKARYIGSNASGSIWIYEADSIELI